MLNKNTKIICTLGPASDSFDKIAEMSKEGMNVARLNFSHGTHEEHRNRIQTVRRVEEETGRNIGVMLDTKGPEIRLGNFENEVENYKIGETVTIVKEDIPGTHDRFTILYKGIFDDVKVGDIILVNDGKQRLLIKEQSSEELVCEILVNGILASHKGCNVPGVKLNMPFISEKDEEDIRFGARNNVDFIAASFVRRAEDILAIRKILEEEGKPKIQIVAKIENEEGYDNLEEILDVADGVMVARGDLGVEVKTELVPIYQKKMISVANGLGKPVIVATHMLDSMTNNPMCTRAEASDVANAILDGCDAVMLSGETAAGLYPVEAVRTMANISRLAETIFPFEERLAKSKKTSSKTIQDAIGIAISDTTLMLDIKAVVVFTQSGITARRVSKFRPDVPIYGVTFTKDVLNRMDLFWGVRPVLSDVVNDMTNDDQLASDIVKKHGLKEGDLIIVTAGYPTGVGATNMMKIISVK